MTRLDHIITEVAAKHGVRIADILKQDRLRRYAYARQECFYRARQAGLSTPQIGRAMGRDHTTVLHGSRAHELRDAVAFRASRLRAFARCVAVPA